MEILVVSDSSHAEKSINNASLNISQLRTVVLRIVKLHLCALVGSCSLGGKVSLNAEIGRPVEKEEHNKEDQDKNDAGSNFEILSFLQHNQNPLKNKINAELEKIGVSIDNVCI